MSEVTMDLKEDGRVEYFVDGESLMVFQPLEGPEFVSVCMTAVTHLEFITGRDVMDCDWCRSCDNEIAPIPIVATVCIKDLRPYDIQIPRAECEALRRDVKQWNLENPIPPAPRPILDVLHEKLASDDITDPEIREMLRRERGL